MTEQMSYELGSKLDVIIENQRVIHDKLEIQNEKIDQLREAANIINKEEVKEDDKKSK